HPHTADVRPQRNNRPRNRHHRQPRPPPAPGTGGPWRQGTATDTHNIAFRAIEGHSFLGGLRDAADKLKRRGQLGVRGQAAEHAQAGVADPGQFGCVQAGRTTVLHPAQRDEHSAERPQGLPSGPVRPLRPVRLNTVMDVAEGEAMPLVPSALEALRFPYLSRRVLAWSVGNVRLPRTRTTWPRSWRSSDGAIRSLISEGDGWTSLHDAVEDVRGRRGAGHAGHLQLNVLVADVVEHPLPPAEQDGCHVCPDVVG